MKRYNSIFYYLALANFLFFLGNSLCILLPVYLKNLGASESYIGIMNNVDKIFTIISAVTLGSIMQGRDRIRLLRVGYIILACAYASYLLVTSLTWSLLLIRVMHGIGFSVAMILGTSIIFEIVPIKDAAEAIGIYGITGALSNAISPFFGEMILSYGYPHQVIFALSVVLVLSSLVITFIMPCLDCGTAAKPLPTSRGSLHLLAKPKFLLMALVSIIFGGGFGVIVTYLPNFIRTTTSFKFSYFFIIYISILIIIRFTFIKQVGRIKRSALLTAVLAVGALMNVFMNFLDSIIVLIIVSVMYGITHGILYPVLDTIQVSIVEPHDRGKANALFTASFNGGMMIFALTLGFLIDYLDSYLAAFDVCAIMFLGAIILFKAALRYGSLEAAEEAAPDIAMGSEQNL
ncbi:MAG TPA: MFS transporter [Spirochaetota bacterium]|nr:MFS transporter [Spirochaetota bacterium]